MTSSYSAAELGDDNISVGIKIPTDVYVAVKKGEALLNTTLGKNGVTIWVQFMDADRAHLTYSLEDAASELESKQKRAPAGVLVPTFAQKPASPKGLSMSLEEAQDRVATKKLDRRRKQGVLNFYPKDSLADEDFKREDVNDFVARAVVVANYLGTHNAVSRIETTMGNHGSFESLHDWWACASSEDRVALLTKSKKFAGKCDISRALVLACPFRNTSFDKETDQELEESTSWSD